MAGRRLLIVTLALAVFLFAAVGVVVAASNASVSIRGTNGTYAYSPRTQYIRVGGTVTWRNRSDAPHTVTSTGGGPLDSGIINPGGTYRARFTAVGSYGYICQVHGTHTGRIVVLAATGAPPETDALTPPTPRDEPPDPLPVAAVGLLAVLVAALFVRRVRRSA